MSKRKPKLFIQIYFDFYDSPKWRSLKWYSKIAYLRMKRKYNPRHTEQITVSYKEMADEMSEPTFGKAVKELSRIGFIDIDQKGGMYRKRNYYTLSTRWRLPDYFPMASPEASPPAMVDIHKA